MLRWLHINPSKLGLNRWRYDPNQLILEGFLWNNKSIKLLIPRWSSTLKGWFFSAMGFFNCIVSGYANLTHSFKNLNFCDVSLLSIYCCTLVHILKYVFTWNFCWGLSIHKPLVSFCFCPIWSGRCTSSHQGICKLNSENWTVIF